MRRIPGRKLTNSSISNNKPKISYRKEAFCETLTRRVKIDSEKEQTILLLRIRVTTVLRVVFISEHLFFFPPVILRERYYKHLTAGNRVLLRK